MRNFKDELSKLLSRYNYLAVRAHIKYFQIYKYKITHNINIVKPMHSRFAQILKYITRLHVNNWFKYLNVFSEFLNFFILPI